MKLWQLFSRDNLPIPLLVLSLSLVCAALPVHSTELTPDNFKSSTSTGVWFIEHFSPYCGHCRAFAPTWDQLVKDKNNEQSAIKLAQVNCAVHGDLCDSNNVKGYPQMNIYKDGEFVETFKGARDLPRLTEFLKRHEPPPQVVTPATNPNPSGTVTVLDDASFHSTLAQGPAFIKFYAPWCGHCKKLAPTWKNLARSLQYKLTIAEVDCEAHKALCKTQDIQGFPTLVYFTDGSKTEYTGGRKIDQLKEFAEKASASGAKSISADKLEEHVSKENLVYALFYPSSESTLLHTLKPLFAPLLGSPTVYAIADPPSSLTSHFSLPSSDSGSGSSTWSIVALKDHDYTTPAAVYTYPSSSSPTGSSQETTGVSPFEISPTEIHTLKSWLELNRLPTTTELTQDTFQSVMHSPARPLVVIAAVTKGNGGNWERVKERMEEVGKKWRARTGGSGFVKMKASVGVKDMDMEERPVVFAYMDVGKWKDWMKSMYGMGGGSRSGSGEMDLDGVEVVIADHKALAYYDTDTSGSSIKLTSSQSIFSALDGIATERIQAKHSENFVERVARYLNNKLQSIESYILNNPIHVGLFVLAGLVLVVVAIRKILAEDPSEREREYLRGKAERLD